MIKAFLNWLANTNFFGEPTIIRRWQCDTFGHEWYCWGWKDEQNVGGHDAWCAWCCRPTGPFPKMKARIGKTLCECPKCKPPSVPS